MWYRLLIIIIHEINSISSIGSSRQILVDFWTDNTTQPTIASFFMQKQLESVDNMKHSWYYNMGIEWKSNFVAARTMYKEIKIFRYPHIYVQLLACNHDSVSLFNSHTTSFFSDKWDGCGFFQFFAFFIHNRIDWTTPQHNSTANGGWSVCKQAYTVATRINLINSRVYSLIDFTYRLSSALTNSWKK